MTAPGTATTDRARAERRVRLGTMVGTTIEWYDFFVFAQAAGLVFTQLFFAPAGLGQLASWATLGISFLFRPLGAIVAGHLGDRLGRKRLLVLTLLLMGGATFLIGVLPTYAAIGVWAPVLLVLLRVLQGFSAGGEWGGAALLAVEHAPVSRRGLWGAYPQIGVPLGLVIASLLVFVLRSALTPEQWLSWGWRVPFLVSVVLIAVGWLIRRAVAESPLFAELTRRRRESSAPLGELFRRHTRQVVLTAVVFIANNAAGYLLIAFFSAYATRTLGMPASPVLGATALASLGWLVFTLWGGALSDRIGRVRTFQLGYALVFVWMLPLFWLVDSRSVVLFGVALFVLTIGLGLSYGPMSAMYAEMFPVQVRYSGVSIGYALGAILGGAFAPLISEALLEGTGWSGSVALYIMALAVVSFVGVSLVPEPRGAELGVAGEPAR